MIIQLNRIITFLIPFHTMNNRQFFLTIHNMKKYATGLSLYFNFRENLKIMTYEPLRREKIKY